jgi:hypothetical protein
MIKPILLYGCEVWGFGKNEVLERVHLKFCKILLNLKSSTPNYMVYGAVHVGHLFGFLCPVSGVANVASDSGLSILDCPFSFL